MRQNAPPERDACMPRGQAGHDGIRTKFDHELTEVVSAITLL
jgi:hypothetical protein